MDPEKDLTVSESSFLERLKSFNDSNIAEVCTHHSTVVTVPG